MYQKIPDTLLTKNKESVTNYLARQLEVQFIQIASDIILDGGTMCRDVVFDITMDKFCGNCHATQFTLIKEWREQDSNFMEDLKMKAFPFDEYTF